MKNLLMMAAAGLGCGFLPGVEIELAWTLKDGSTSVEKVQAEEKDGVTAFAIPKAAMSAGQCQLPVGRRMVRAIGRTSQSVSASQKLASGSDAGIACAWIHALRIRTAPSSAANRSNK